MTLASGLVLVPLAALLASISPTEFVRQVADPVVLDAIAVSLAAVLCALALVVLLGTPVAYMLARAERSRLTGALDVLFDLPMVLPPAVAGIALLAAFGAGGPIGEPLAQFGVAVPFTRFAVVVALAFVAAPLYIRQAQSAFAACERPVLEAAWLSGAGQLRHFFQIELPLARRGLFGGLALAGARALGEFGATIMFAGSVAGVTQTITLAIYGSMYTDANAAFALAILLLLLTVGLSALARIVAGRPVWDRA